MRFSNILDLIGNTPLVEIRRLNPYPNVKILAKIEAKNPGGSVKDRVALAMIEAAEKSGELTPDKTVIEATSGNTGIGLAMVCAVKGYRLTLLMSESASEERKRIVRAYGANIILTPGRMGTDGAIEEAYRMYREEPGKYVLMDQFNNPAGVEAHYRGTGKEIWDQTQGEVTHAVASLGTSGTAMGITRRLKEFSPDVRVVAVEPYPQHKIQGLKNMRESYAPGIYDKSVLDAVVNVRDEVASDLCRRLAAEEGLFVGMSSGAALAGALQVASDLDRGLVVVVFPDGGERYLSTPLFAEAERKGPGLFDVKTQEKKYLTPGPKGIGLFTVGPSLDAVGDIEAWRRVLILDVLARYMRFRDIEASVVVGLADLDDRALEASRRSGETREDHVRRVEGELAGFAGRLGVGDHVKFALAGESRATLLSLCRALLSKGLAYEKLHSVYFDVERDSEYGGLSRMDLTKVSLGKTVDLNGYVKENPRDFTLLKRANLQDLKLGHFLQTEWGSVRPSWYLQQAAAALDNLGRISLNLAGEAHWFPHQENLRAIWSKAADTDPEAWCVARPIMSKDPEGRVPDLAALLDEFKSPAALRMWLLSTSYRKPLVYTPDSLSMWSKNRHRVQEAAVLLCEAADRAKAGGDAEPRTGLLDDLAACIEDDLSLHHFWPKLFEHCREINKRLSEDRMTPGEISASWDQMRAVDGILGILDKSGLPVPESKWPEEIRGMVKDRQAARADKDFALADELREKIRAAGYLLEDTPSGTRLFAAG